MSHGAPSSGSRRSWRASPATPTSDPNTKRLARIAFSATALALAVVLGWLLIPPFFAGKCRFVSLPIVDYELLTVPPPVFVEEDRLAFAAPDQAAHGGAIEDVVSLRELQTASAVRSLLADRIRQIAPHRQDVLVLYVNAHGLSDQRRAYLLCSDFDPLRPESGRIAVEDLLREVSRSPAALKLVVLDAGRIGYDPRLGVVVNEFPTLLDREVRAVADANLWVLSSHDLGETSQPSFALKRSRFGQVMYEALAGAADADGDEQLDLAEFADFVSHETLRWSKESSGGRFSQTPRLFRGGTGRVAEAPKGINIRSVRRDGNSATAADFTNWSFLATAAAADPPPTPTPTATASPSGTAAPAPSATPTTTPTTTATATPTPTAAVAAPTASASATASSASDASSPAATVRPLLDEAWQWRDRIARRESSESWTPLDFAPHLWREFQEALVNYDLRSRSGSAYDQTRLAADLRTNVSSAPDRINRRGGASGDRRETIANRLATAFQQFETSEIKQSYDAQPADFRAALQLRNDALFRAVDYLHWLGRAVAMGDGDDLSLSDLQRLFVARERLARRIDDVLTAAARGDNLRMQRELLAEDQRAVREQLTALDGRLQNEVESLISSPQQAGGALRIESLLATGLPSAVQRRGLLAALEKSEPPRPIRSAALAREESARRFDRRRWQQVATLASLEVAAIQASSTESTELSSSLEELRRAVANEQLGLASDDDEAIKQSLSRFGTAIERFYRQVPARVHDQLAALDAAPAADRLAKQRGAERLLRLVDARDALAVDEQVSIAPVPQASLKPPKLILTAKDRVAVRSDEWTPLEIKVQTDNGLPAQIRPSLTFDSQLLEIAVDDGSSRLATSAATEPVVTLDDRGATTLRYRVRATVEARPPTTLDVRVASGDGAFTKSLIVELPAADRMDLLVRGSPGTVRSSARPDGWAADDDGLVELMLFPNRITTYRLALSGRSGRPRKVEAVFYVAPPDLPIGDQTGVWPETEAEWRAGGYQPLSTVKEIAVPADGSPASIPFVVPTTDATPPAADAATTAKPPGDKPLPPKVRPMIHRSVVMEIRDLADRKKRWVKEITLAVQPPQNYLQAEAAYDRLLGRITVVVKPIDFDNDGRVDSARLPPEGSKVKWVIGNDIDPAATVQPLGEVTAPSFEARLFADVPPDPRRNVDVQLTVDDYPRAFVWRVNCGQTEQHLRPRRDLRRVKITSPQAGQAFLAPAETVPVVIEADAPADAFRDRVADDVLEVGLDATLDRNLQNDNLRRFHSDRQVEFWNEELGPDGVMKIDAQVHDFRIDVYPRGLKNAVVEIGTRLSLGKTDPEQDFVRVTLDGAPPRLDVSTQPSGGVVKRGDDLIVVIQGFDLSGIKKIEAAFDLQGTGKMEKPELAVYDSKSDRWRITLPTKELNAGRHPLLIQAVDNVGLTSEMMRLAVSVTGAAPTSTVPVRPENRILGTVVIRGEGQPGVTVRLEGSSLPPTTTDSAGRFTFRDVPPGQYKVSAKGAVRNRIREGKPVDVDLKASPAPPANITVELE